MNTLMLVSMAALILLIVSELHYRFVQWMEKSSEVFEIEYQ
jgi:hypothetical protein